MYRFDRPEPSYWEATGGDAWPVAEPLSADDQCDIAIIGGGYTGLSTAYHLAARHSLDVRVLEAGHIGWGASGRNGGFCCVGSDGLGAEGMVKIYGEDVARDYYRSQVDAVELVREIIDAEGIQMPTQGESEATIACSPRGFERLKAHAEFQFRTLGLDTSVLPREAFADQYFDSPLQHGGAVFKPTFGLHPLRYVRGLGSATEKRGVKLHARSEVIDWTKQDGRHRLATAGGTLSAKQVLVATNGFTPEHLHDALGGRPLPLISAIVVTRKLTDNEIEAQNWKTSAPSATSLNLLNYFRLLPDKRFLFGGRGSSRGDDDSSMENYKRTTRRLYELFPEWRDVPIEYRWHGLVCITRRLTPAIGRLADDPSVWFGFGYHGNGVAAATWAGRELATWIANGSNEPPASLPGPVVGMPGRFPMAKYRLSYLRAMLGITGFADRFN